VSEASASLRRVASLVRPERRRLFVATLLTAATAACGVALMATSAWLIARAAEHPSVVALGVAIIGVRFFAVSRGLSRYGERLVGHDTALRALADLRVHVYDRLEALAPAGLPAFRRGDLLARIVGDVDSLQDLMVRVIPPSGAALLVGILTVGTMGYILPAAGVILGIGLLLAGVGVPWTSNRLARWREDRLAAARGELSTHVVDLVEGAQELVAFGCVDRQVARVIAADAELTRIATSTSRVAGVGAALVTFLNGATVLGILLVGIPVVHSGRLTGPLLAVIALTPLAAFEIVTGLPSAAQSLVRVRHSAARVFDVIEAQPPVEDPAVPRPIPSGPPRIAVRGLRARYGGSAPWALDGIDLDLVPGHRVGIIGPSGAGKSTLAAVLARLLPYEAGSVTLQDVELSDLDGDDVRRIIGGVAQETHVFNTTLRENLLLARREATDGAVHDALERARLQAWVDQLDVGLDTEVGGDGGRMSGGQRQRLGIARALLADFPVLILDEPGEHLDTATADALVAELVDLTEGHTTIMITHRLAGLEPMDEIIVLDGGRVIERGTHAALIDGDGPYAEQWRRERRLELEGASRS